MCSMEDYSPAAPVDKGLVPGELAADENSAARQDLFPIPPTARPEQASN
jgi:hypothetical protein